MTQINSSSGSETSSDSSSETDDSSSESFANALPAPLYTEQVPDGVAFFVLNKSRIMHKAKLGAGAATCRLQ